MVDLIKRLYLEYLNHKSFQAIVYKTVSRECVVMTERNYSKQRVQKWLSTSLNDPIVKILSSSSNLTKTQLETVLIDFLSLNLSAKALKNEEKALFRLSKAGISRGAFNHTLKQARKNIIQSIYTILLLGYLGIFEDTRLDAYLEAANKLRSYVTAYKNAVSDETLSNEHLRMVSMLREELEASLDNLSNTRSLSKV